MSLRYKGAVISATPPTTSSSGAAGSWTLQQQMQAQAGGNWPFGGPFNYIEDVFSTWLYTGNGSTQTITNGIDLAGKGGLVWVKMRNSSNFHTLYDTNRGANNYIFTDQTDAQNSYGVFTNELTSFNSNGFSLGADSLGTTNSSGNTFASWTFRKQPKFFDVVTYTGNYTARTIAHSLGSVPGCIIVKKTSSADDWRVYHRSLATNQYMTLETTAAVGTSATMWNNTAPTSTVFSIGAEGSVNDPGETFVAYLFAHNAGGFGLTGTDNVISCGSFTIGGSGNATVDLGFEPQWVMTKATDVAGNWRIADVMRGMTANGTDAVLNANLSNAEASANLQVAPTATGFQVSGGLPYSATYIYIAIRRGPMKTPTSGTSVFSPVSAIATSGTARTTGFPVDLQILAQKDKANYINTWSVDRLRGVSTTDSASGRYVFTNTTDAEATANAVTRNFGNTGYVDPSFFGSLSMIWWNFRRAPGFFDVVCYTGTGVSGLVVNHNLGVTPELLIYKNRATAGTNWFVLNSSSNYGNLNSDVAFGGPLSITLGSTSYTINTTGTSTNASGQTYVAYLFASCPGVSKVGSYTGTGATQTIDCGFTGGARFVMIKRTDSTGNWWVWDTARGMTAGTDYRIPLNTTDADSNTNNVYTTTGGFQIVTSDATINASGGSYIYLAIA